MPALSSHMSPLNVVSGSQKIRSAVTPQVRAYAIRVCEVKTMLVAILRWHLQVILTTWEVNRHTTRSTSLVLYQ